MNSKLLRGTLDMLVLKIVAVGPNRGYAIAQRLRQISKDFVVVHLGSLYPALLSSAGSNFPKQLDWC